MVLRAVFLSCTLLALGSGAMGSTNGVLLDRRLAECKAIRPFARYEVADGSRIYITLPEDIYPRQPLKEAQRGATFGWISNDAPSGVAGRSLIGKRCWSTYGGFSAISRCTKRTACNASVEIRLKSAVAGIPDYQATFFVIPL
jgi:hypothetical protein